MKVSAVSGKALRAAPSLPLSAIRVETGFAGGNGKGSGFLVTREGRTVHFHVLGVDPSAIARTEVFTVAAVKGRTRASLRARIAKQIPLDPFVRDLTIGALRSGFARESSRGTAKDFVYDEMSLDDSANAGPPCEYWRETADDLPRRIRAGFERWEAATNTLERLTRSSDELSAREKAALRKEQAASDRYSAATKSLQAARDAQYLNENPFVEADFAAATGRASRAYNDARDDYRKALGGVTALKGERWTLDAELGEAFWRVRAASKALDELIEAHRRWLANYESCIKEFAVQNPGPDPGGGPPTGDGPSGGDNPSGGGGPTTPVETLTTLDLATSAEEVLGAFGFGSLLVTGWRTGGTVPWLAHFTDTGDFTADLTWPAIGTSVSGIDLLGAPAAARYVVGIANSSGFKAFVAKTTPELGVDTGFDGDGVGLYAGTGGAAVTAAAAWLRGGQVQVLVNRSGNLEILLVNATTGAAEGIAPVSLSTPLPDLQNVSCDRPDADGLVVCGGTANDGATKMGIVTFTAPSSAVTVNATSRALSDVAQIGGVGRLPSGRVIATYLGMDVALKVRGLDGTTLADAPDFNGGAPLSVGNGLIPEPRGVIAWGTGAAILASQLIGGVTNYQPSVVAVTGAGALHTAYGDATTPGVRLLPFQQVRLNRGVLGTPASTLELAGTSFATANAAKSVHVRITGATPP